MPKLFIATPIQGSHVYARYCASLFKTGSHLHEHGIESTYATLRASDVALQRDVLADMFLREADCTHLLFFDSDMQPDPSLALKLLSFQKDFIGTIYAQRALDLQRVAQFAADGSSPAHAVALAHEFHFSGGSMRVEGELCTTDWIGMGFVLISRACFEQIAAKTSLISYQCPYNRELQLRGFFRQIAEPNGDLISEDISFCRRAHEAGIELFAYHRAKIEHVGEMAFGTRFSEFMQANVNLGKANFKKD